MREQTCSKCRFFQKNDEELGECHRHAPLPGKEAEDNAAFWPTVGTWDWCGEWGPHPVKQYGEKHALAGDIPQEGS